MAETFYITTPIYYINDRPHIGHTYCTVACDIIARFWRKKGLDVHFLTGTDENSIKTIEAAEKCGKDVQHYVDEMAEVWKGAWRDMGISCDDFIRTTEKRHHEGVTRLVKRIEAAGDFYIGDYDGLYCKGCEAFLNKSDLVDGKCPHHNTAPDTIQEKNFFFRLSKYERPLLDHIERNPEFILPEARRNEVVSFIKSGLKDLSVTRAGMKWGLPFPIDSSQITYVWLDALTNYLSALGYGGSESPKYWPANIHMVGKDIIRFHCVYWPAFLMSAGVALPRTIFAHGFFTIGGVKISKSLGNAIDPLALQAKYGRDALRYYLFSEFSFGQDGDFSEQGLVKRLNQNLGNDLGNLLSRTLNMIGKYCDGKIPVARPGSLQEDLVNCAKALGSKVTRHFTRVELSECLSSIWELVALANRYVETNQPWKLAKDPGQRERLETVLCNLAETNRIAAHALATYMPETFERILAQLGCPASERDLTFDEAMKWGRLPAGQRIALGGVLFPRIESQIAP